MGEQIGRGATVSNRIQSQSGKSPADSGQIASQHKRQGLLLSRQHVLQQLEAAQNPRHREILQSALVDLDAQIARLV